MLTTFLRRLKMTPKAKKTFSIVTNINGMQSVDTLRAEYFTVDEGFLCLTDGEDDASIEVAVFAPGTWASVREADAPQ